MSNPFENMIYEFVESAPTEAIIDLYKEGGWWKEDPVWREKIPHMIRGSYAFLVIRVACNIIGMGRIISDGFSDAYIQDVVVKKEWRGQGLGSEIIRRLTAFCQNAGIHWVGLVAEPKTQSFYERLHFKTLEGYQPMLLQAKE